MVLGLRRAEERFVLGALRQSGALLEAAVDLVDHGYFVCDNDLEDELIRAVGTAAVEDALDEMGHLVRFRTFQYQPEWRDRSPADQPAPVCRERLPAEGGAR